MAPLVLNLDTNLKLNGSHPDVFKDRIQGLHQSNKSCFFKNKQDVFD